MKRNNVLLTASLTLALSIGILSCNKQTGTSSVTHRHITTQSTTSKTLADLGELHNEGLDFLISTGAAVTEFPGYEPKITEFCLLNGVVSEARIMLMILGNPEVQPIIHDRDGVELPKYLKEHDMTAENDFLTETISAINTASTGEDAVAALNGVATKISSSSEIGDESKAILLQGIAVGKSSVNYWNNQIALGTSSDWIIKTADAAGKDPIAMPYFNWRKLAAQDLAGAIIGGIFGGWVGAVGAGLGASACEAISQLM